LSARARDANPLGTIFSLAILRPFCILKVLKQAAIIVRPGSQGQKLQSMML
jgi:hypothetical protein